MKKGVIYIFFSLFFVVACKEDEDRVISTDLPTEATQLFLVSKAWSEALFFTQISFEQYAGAESLDLPGCPEISVDQSAKQVTLTFDSEAECEQIGTATRSGKLILDLAQSESESPIWFLEYENYTFEDASLDGIRTFTKNPSGLINESFETMTHKTKNELTHQFGGELTHMLSFLNGVVVGLTTEGMISGRNPAGRNFIFDLNEKHEFAFSCFQNNLIFPVSGREIWQVSRSESDRVLYNLTFREKENCKVEAYVVLPDGRRLLLNP